MIFPFLNDARGNIAILAALSALSLCGFAAAAVDFALMSQKKSQLSQLLDSSVLSALIEGGSESEMIAYAEAELFDRATEAGIGDSQLVGNFFFDGVTLRAEAELSHKTALLSVVGIPDATLSVASAGRLDSMREPLCFMAMHPSRKHTLELKSSVGVDAPDCNIYGNSDHPFDVVDPHTSSNFIYSRSIQAIGYGHHYLDNVIPSLVRAEEYIPDPLADLPIPMANGCDHVDRHIGGGNHDLQPGVYCGGLRIDDGAAVTLEPGLYFIEGGDFDIVDSNVRGTSVTLVLGQDDVELGIFDSVLRLSAPESGEHAGLAIIGARIETDHVFEDSVIDIHGVVYLLNGRFDWENEGDPNLEHLWTAWIIDGVTWTGSGVVRYNFSPSTSPIPYPPAMHVIPRSIRQAVLVE